MANVVKFYNLNKKGGKLAEGEIDLDSQEIPPNSTIIQPPIPFEEVPIDKIMLFDEDKQEWILQDDPNYEELYEPWKEPDFVPKEQRIEELEMALADLMGGM